MPQLAFVGHYEEECLSLTLERSLDAIDQLAPDVRGGKEMSWGMSWEEIVRCGERMEEGSRWQCG